MRAGYDVSPDTERALASLAPLRSTARALVERIHARRESDDAMRQAAIAADTEVLTALLAEAYRRGAGAVLQGLHRSEGVDHEMIDQALEFAMRRDDEKA